MDFSITEEQSLIIDSFKNFTAIGEESAIRLARLIDSSYNLESVIILLTSPVDKASSALISLHVRVISRALPFPTIFGNRCVPPSQGMVPDNSCPILN